MKAGGRALPPKIPLPQAEDGGRNGWTGDMGKEWVDVNEHPWRVLLKEKIGPLPHPNSLEQIFFTVENYPVISHI